MFNLLARKTNERLKNAQRTGKVDNRKKGDSLTNLKIWIILGAEPYIYDVCPRNTCVENYGFLVPRLVVFIGRKTECGCEHCEDKVGGHLTSGEVPSEFPFVEKAVRLVVDPRKVYINER